MSAGSPSDFNPRTPVGCDLGQVDVSRLALGFQSTHPSGVRRHGMGAVPRCFKISIHAPQWGATRNGVSDAAYRCYFNPRTPVGCDDRRQGEHHRPGISIHAPQWGATCPSSSLLVLVIVFQSTHPSGVRRAPITKVRQARYFNPRTPVGCDLPTAPPLFDANNFNPRTPVGCDRRPAIAGDPQRPISIHAPQWGATRTGTTITNGFTHFNPRTPVGCDLSTEPNRSASPVISIHAPQWGATVLRLINVWRLSYFNPRTPVGCDTHRLRTRWRFSNFNPRTPVGCDDFCPHFAHIIPDFNPRTPVGCDPPLASTPEPVKEFQSTHPSGVRRGRHRVRPHHDPISIHAPQWGATAMRRRRPSDALFQSTHPSGVRPWRPVQVGRPQRISIHAPQWGATHALGHDNGAVGISIHAPQWGATADYRPARFQDWISIHAPQWGATTSGLFLVLKWIVFQSTHPSGVRRLRPVLHTVHGRISIHAPQWGATRRAVRWYTAIRNFNPRIPVGCDHDYPVFQYASGVFQSTHPSGVRQNRAREALCHNAFQSTHPSGVRR